MHNSLREKSCLLGFKGPDFTYGHRTHLQCHRSGVWWTQVTVSKYGLKSRFVELSKWIILWGEIPFFGHQGIPQLFNMYTRSFWEGRKGLRPSASSELINSSGQILIWCNSVQSSGVVQWWNLNLHYFISRLKHTGHLAFPVPQQGWTLGQKATIWHNKRLHACVGQSN